MKTIWQHRVKARDSPIVNWGRGRLAPFESALSIVSKFSRLNGISISESRKFFSEYIGGKFSQGQDTPLRRLSNIIDEPFYKLRHLSWCAAFPTIYGTFRSDEKEVVSSHEIRYCASCARNGYHSVAHHYSWLRFCPIHPAEKLICETVQLGTGSNFDRQARLLGNILDQRTEGKWTSIKHIDGLCEIDFSALFECVNWIRAANKIAQMEHLISLIHLGGGNYYSNHCPTNIGRLSWKVPIPKRIKAAMPSLQKAADPEVISLDYCQTTKLRKIINLVGANVLFEAYKLDKCIGRELSKYRSNAEKYLALIRDSFRSKRWNWGRFEYGWMSRWEKVNPSYWPYSGARSPLDFAENIIRSNWIDLDISGTSSMARCRRAWECYETSMCTLQWHGLAKRSPRFCLNLDPDVTNILDLILVEEVRLFCDCLRKWLEHAASIDCVELDDPYMPACGNVILDDEQESAFILSWGVDHHSAVKANNIYL